MRNNHREIFCKETITQTNNTEQTNESKTTEYHSIASDHIQQPYKQQLHFFYITFNLISFQFKEYSGNLPISKFQGKRKNTSRVRGTRETMANKKKNRKKRYFEIAGSSRLQVSTVRNFSLLFPLIYNVSELNLPPNKVNCFNLQLYAVLNLKLTLNYSDAK